MLMLGCTVEWRDDGRRICSPGYVGYETIARGDTERPHRGWLGVEEVKSRDIKKSEFGAAPEARQRGLQDVIYS